MAKLSDAQIAEIKLRHPCDEIAAKYVTLRKHGQKVIGPCPICSPDPHSRSATRFEADADGWVCANCADGGDVIKLVCLVEKLKFREAVDRLGGAREVDPEQAKKLEAEREGKRAARDAENARYREKERGTVFEIWRRGVPIEGTPVAEYLARRHVEFPSNKKILRALDKAPLFAHGGKDAPVAHRGWVMLAAIVNNAGVFSGLHQTFIDLSQPKGKAKVKDPDSGTDLPSKKVRGTKSGGHIELVPCADPHTLFIGEGIETVGTVFRAHGETRRPVDGLAFWSSVDLGNLGGKAAETVTHPTLKSAGGRAIRVPGPVPDLSAASIEIPASVRRVVILGDGDSDPFSTMAVIVRAAARWRAARPDLEVVCAMSPADADFNDLAPAWSRVLEIVDAAAPPVMPAIAASAEVVTPKKVAARKRRDRVSSPGPEADSSSRDVSGDNVVVLPVVRVESGSAAASVRPPAAGTPPLEKSASSQTGAYRQRKRDRRKGAGRGALKRRNLGGDGRVPEDPAALDLRLSFFPMTDLGNAERFRERYRGRLLWCQAIGWLYWDGKRWARDGAIERVKMAAHETVRSIHDEADALAASDQDKLVEVKTKGRGEDKEEFEIYLSDRLRLWARDSESNAKLNQLAEQADAYLAIAPEKLDSDPFKINVQNGTIVVSKTPDSDGRYVAFRNHDPADLITKIAPVSYDPAAECPKFDAFLSEVQPKPENRRFLMAWRGLSLTGDTSEQRLAVFWGKGKNGKSVFEDTTAFVAGDYGETVPIETFLAEGRGRNAGQATPDLAILPGVRLLRTSEPKRGAALDEALIKLATGGEPILARHLNRDYFKFYPQFKLTISGNYRPKIEGADEGIWRRVVLMPWRFTVPEDRRDNKLGEKLKAEAAGILNRLLDGLCDWLDHGLIVPEDAEAATADYRSDSDPLGRFLNACVERASGERVQATAMHDLFVAWARANSATEWSPRGLALALKERGFVSTKSSVSFWLDSRLKAKVSDFVDSHGKPIAQIENDARPAGDDVAVE